MLNRILALDGAEELTQAAGNREGVAVCGLDNGTVPEGTVAVIGTAAQAAEVVDAALTIGNSHAALLTLLADAIACREGAPIGAEARVLGHATRFAEALELSADDRFFLERGTLLRDVGKLRIGNDILLKASVLSYDEWVLIRRHTLLGAELLEERGISGPILDIVRYHHECWDGDGYPKNLEGEQIPYLARVMKILDVYCAMTSPRHYRQTKNSAEEAVAYLKSEQGKHYDPQLVDVFLKTDVGQ